MKKVKILFAIIAVVAMLSTVAFAADSTLKFAADTVEYTDGETLALTIKANSDVKIGATRCFTVQYDGDVWEFAGIESELAGAGAYDYYGDDIPAVDVWLSMNESVDITSNSDLCVLKFTKKSGDAIGTVFTLAANEDIGANWCDSTGAALDYSGEIEVKAAEPEKVPTVEAIAEDIKAAKTSIVSVDGKTEYTDVAIFEEAFNLADLADATAFGFKIGEKKSNYVDIKGDGTLNAVLAIYGVSGDLTVDTYKTILK